jgi:hypothetical protein
MVRSLSVCAVRDDARGVIGLILAASSNTEVYVRQNDLQLVRRDLDLVAIGIAKIDRVRNLVILELE